ncbi:hypothetical protein PQX77_008658 [Marasmius sp. AFHP31]|nr:hypothetical protein PQX77_008658 [Marasmius sp. AFHP31]
MAASTITEPQQLEVYLRTLVVTLHADVNDHPLLELGDKACTYMIDLITTDPAHKVDEKRYRGFYSVVQTIVKHFETIQTERNRNCAHSCGRPSLLDKYRLRMLKTKLNAGHRTASRSKPPVCKWEDVVILTGGVVSTISNAPGLDVLKPLGSTLSQIGELIKTLRGNKAEYTDLLNIAIGILAELASKMEVQTGDVIVKPTEDMERSVRSFERTLIRIRDSLTELTRESRTERLGRLMFANKTKEELALLRRDLGDAQMLFMVRFYIFFAGHL